MEYKRESKRKTQGGGVLQRGNAYNTRAYLGELSGKGERDDLLPALILAPTAIETTIMGAGVVSAYITHKLLKEKAQREGISLDENAKGLGVVFGEGERKEELKLKYGNEEKIKSQMKKRGWSEKEILEALQEKGIPAQGKKGKATRYKHPKTGKSVVIDNQTGEIFHVGGDGFKYDD